MATCLQSLNTLWIRSMPPALAPSPFANAMLQSGSNPQVYSLVGSYADPKTQLSDYFGSIGDMAGANNSGMLKGFNLAKAIQSQAQQSSSDPVAEAVRKFREAGSGNGNPSENGGGPAPASSDGNPYGVNHMNPFATAMMMAISPSATIGMRKSNLSSIQDVQESLGLDPVSGWQALNPFSELAMGSPTASLGELDINGNRYGVSFGGVDDEGRTTLTPNEAQKRKAYEKILQKNPNAFNKSGNGQPGAIGAAEAAAENAKHDMASRQSFRSGGSGGDKSKDGQTGGSAGHASAGGNQGDGLRGGSDRDRDGGSGGGSGGGTGCFAAGTQVTMDDGSTKPVESVKIGDITAGGPVTMVMQADGTDEVWYDYGGVHVTGSHKVYHEGAWMPVEETGAPTTEVHDTLYTFNCEDHRIYSDGVVFADYIEHDACHPIHKTIDMVSVNILNGE